MTARTALDMCRWLQTLGLRPACLLVAHAIGHRLNPDGEAFPSLRTLAKDTGLGLATVKRSLNELEGEGVITRTRRKREHGGYGSTIYSFGGQWDLFRMRTAGPGVGSRRAEGRLTASQADLRPERSSSNGAGNNPPGQVNGAGDGERCGRTFDIEEYMERTEAARVEAARKGFEGPWDDRSVSVFLGEDRAVSA